MGDKQRDKCLQPLWCQKSVLSPHVFVEIPFEFGEVYKRRKRIKFENITIPVVPIKELIAMKEHFNKPQDKADSNYNGLRRRWNFSIRQCLQRQKRYGTSWEKGLSKNSFVLNLFSISIYNINSFMLYKHFNSRVAQSSRSIGRAAVKARASSTYVLGIHIKKWRGW